MSEESMAIERVTTEEICKELNITPDKLRCSFCDAEFIDGSRFYLTEHNELICSRCNINRVLEKVIYEVKSVRIIKRYELIEKRHQRK